MSFAPKIFGIGLSKTGTTSLFAALDELDFRTITFRHMVALGLEDWRSGAFRIDYLGAVDAATDLPIGTYFRELDQLYPGSKFILTERPLDPWLASIERQFTTSPEPATAYRRDVRMATYGVARFNRDRFARVHSDHAAGVRDYFKDRPDDLLIQNYFDGDGWDSLCTFLNRPVPDTPFPNVKPGHPTKSERPAPAAKPQKVRVTKQLKLSFVLPLVHPENPVVTDYDRVERVLRMSLASLMAVTGATVQIIVVAHRLPAWHAEVAEKVTFLILPEHDVFSHWRGAKHIDRTKKTFDKGLKWSLGAAYALASHRPDFVLPFDADDFVRSDIAQVIASAPDGDAARDGYFLKSGYHALLSPKDDSFDLSGVMAVTGFNGTCGSCRVIRASRLRAALNEPFADLKTLKPQDMCDDTGRVSEAVLSPLVDWGQRTEEDRDGLFRTLARHTGQTPYFQFGDITTPVVAKGCGHGNHVGPRGGDVHWNNVTGLAENDVFLTAFGLSDHPSLEDAPDAETQAMASVATTARDKTG